MVIELVSVVARSTGLDSNFSGAVAQLGERLICIQEVAGSIPTSSTILSWTLKIEQDMEAALAPIGLTQPVATSSL